MAGVRWKARTEPIATGTSALTVMQILAAANHRVKVVEWGVSFAGVSNTGAPIRVDLLRQTTAGTMTQSASTLKKDPNSGAETLQTTIFDSASAEPTAGDILDTIYVHPQTGYDWPSPRREVDVEVQGSERLGIRVTAAASVNCVASMKGEE